MVYLKKFNKLSFTLLTFFIAGVAGCAPSNTISEVKGDIMNKCVNFEDYQRVKEILFNANTVLSENKYANANKLFEKGIDILGDLYLSPNLLDDSGMKNTLADIEEKKGNIQQAANIRKKVLESRLDNYEKKLNCK
jgi:hypothetical protein